LYTLLEDHIIPLYFNRNAESTPKGWQTMVKNSMKTLISQFSALRMVGDYVQDYYIPAAERGEELNDNNKELARRLAGWKNGVGPRFNTVKIDGIVIDGMESDNNLLTNQPINVKVEVDPGDMLPEELLVELVIGLGEGQDFVGKPSVCPLTRVDSTRKRITYVGQCSVEQEGKHIYGIRVLPVTKGLASPLETHLVLWG
jgi:phosphorylase/glycogen(starch) synthase